MFGGCRGMSERLSGVCAVMAIYECGEMEFQSTKRPNRACRIMFCCHVGGY